MTTTYNKDKPWEDEAQYPSKDAAIVALAKSGAKIKVIESETETLALIYETEASDAQRLLWGDCPSKIIVIRD